MADHLKTGRKGEALAAAFVRKQGMQIIDRNWKHSRAEIDIIAKADEVLVFIEVKTLQHGLHTEPELFITRHKMERIMHAAAIYMDIVGFNGEIRFDLITVALISQTNSPGGRVDIKHYPDAFFPGWDD